MDDGLSSGEAEQIVNDEITANGGFKRKLRRMKPWWGILHATNSHRNTIAHKLDQDKFDRRTADLKEMYLTTMTPQNATEIENQPDDYTAMMACSTCGGFIATLESRIPPRD